MEFGAATVVSILAVGAFTLAVRAAPAPGPTPQKKAEDTTQDEAPPRPIAVLTAPDGTVITPFDCGMNFCTLPREGWAAVVVELKRLDRENADLRAAAAKRAKGTF